MCGKIWQLTVVLWTLGEGKSKNCVNVGKGQECEAGGPKLEQEEDKQCWFQPIPDWCLPNLGKSKARGGADISENVLAHQPQDKTRSIIRGIWSPWFTECDDINKRDSTFCSSRLTLSPILKFQHKEGVATSRQKWLNYVSQRLFVFFQLQSFLALRWPKFQELRIQNSLSLDKKRLIFIIPFWYVATCKNFFEAYEVKGINVLPSGIEISTRLRYLKLIH